MTTSVTRVERTSGSTGRPSVAPAPSGGVYFAEGGDSTGVAHVSRIDSAGAIVWTKEITISGSTTANGVTPHIHSSTDHLAVVLRYFETAGSVYKTAVVLYQSDGTLVWQKTVPVTISRAAALNDASGLGFGGLALAEDESVYMTGMLSSNTQLALVKLNGSDGSLAWVVDLYPSTGALTSDNPAEIELLSGGDPVVMFFGGEIPTATGEYTHVQRITASTGAAAWTRSVLWNYGAGCGASIGVDPSDNIYLGWPVDGSNNLGVVKLDSSGTTLWNKRVSTGGSATTKGALKLSATSTGVHLGYSMSTPTRGHFFVNAAGTGSTTSSFTYSASGTAAHEVHGSRAAGSQLLMVFSATISSVTRATIIRSDETTTADNGSYGAVHTRASSSVSLTTGAAVIASPTYTRASAPSLTLSSASITEASGGLVATPLLPVVSCTATGRASTLLFGTAVVPGVQLPTTVTTAFGTADARNRGLYATGKPSGLAFGTALGKTTYSATGLAPTVAFGTAAVDSTTRAAPTAIAPTTTFGDPDSIRGVGPAPVGIASSVDPTLAFGTAVALDVLNATATGFSTTVIPAPSTGWGLTATGLASALAFGTAKVGAPSTATGFKSTAVGTPTARVPILAAGFSSTLFGIPDVGNAHNAVASGWSATAFGTPATRGASRTRGAKFRTVFGTARAERTAP